MLSEYDIANLPNILRGDGDWFTANLLRLISMADESNLKKLFQSFPEEVDLVNHHTMGREKALEFRRKQILTRESEHAILRK